MKKLVVVAMFIALAIALVPTVFAASGTLPLPPGFKDGIGLDAVSPDLTFLEFYLLAPTVASQNLNLTFILAVNNTQNSAQTIAISTRTLGGSVFNRSDPYPARQTKFFAAADVSCPVNDVCQLTLSANEPPPGNTCFVIFDSLLIIFDNTSGDIVSILPPGFIQCQ